MYEWLKDYHRLIEEISYLEFNLEQSEKELKRWISGDLSGIRLQADSDGAKLEERIEKIQEEIAFKKEQYNDLICLINKFNGLENQILKLKYVEGYTLEGIAEHLNYSPSYINKKHAAIMKMIKFADSLNLSLK